MRRGAHPPFRRCGPSCPPALMSTGDMAPPLGPPSRRLPAKHGADEEVWTSVQLDQPCTSQGAPPTKEHTTQGGYLARSGNSHPHIEQRPPCGLCPWRVLAEEEERKRSEEPPTPGPRVGELGPFGNRGREEEGRRKGWGGEGGEAPKRGLKKQSRFKPHSGVAV